MQEGPRRAHTTHVHTTFRERFQWYVKTWDLVKYGEWMSNKHVQSWILHIVRGGQGRGSYRGQRTTHVHVELFFWFFFPLTECV